MKTKRIAMWSGPRNISTALMRSFENRADCEVVDEPLYAFYLRETGLDHPEREAILASQSSDWREVANALCHTSPAPVFYQKHMTHHILPGMDLGFTAALQNCFLIRRPYRIIVSYAKVRPRFSFEELGFTQQHQLFKRERERLGTEPPVLDATLTLENPRGVLEQLCERLDIDFVDSMLHWPPGPRATDGVWGRAWYGSVWQSTGFSADTSGVAGIAEEFSPEQQIYYERAMAIYDEMLPFALRG